MTVYKIDHSGVMGKCTGFLSILHTWRQTLQPHPHIHCVVPGGGLSLDHCHWLSSRSSFFLPVKVLSRIFRSKFVASSSFSRRFSWQPGSGLSPDQFE
jgi:hypothetical protein